MILIRVPMIPPSPNELRRKYRNPHAYKELREQWEHDIFYCCPPGRVRNTLKDFAQTHRIRVQISVWHTKEYDADNLAGCQKPILDALVNLGFLRNDNRIYLELEEPKQFMTISTKENHTEIRISPILHHPLNQKL